MEQEKNSAEHDSAEQSESSYSSEDEDGVLLTNQVEEKLLTVVAKIRNKDPSIYNIDKPVFEGLLSIMQSRTSRPSSDPRRRARRPATLKSHTRI